MATGPVSETDPAPAAAAADGDDVLLRADNLVKYFPIKGTGLFREKEYVHAVDGVSLSIRRGQTFGIVGETGCGKSTLARCVARLYDVTSGSNAGILSFCSNYLCTGKAGYDGPTGNGTPHGTGAF